MIKKLCINGLLLVLMLAVLFSSSTIGVLQVFATSEPFAPQENLQFETKEYSKATIDDDFAGDSVMVVMDKHTSGINKTHRSSFFGNFEKQTINDLTQLTEKGKNRVADDEFRQILEIKLPTDSKQNVLDTIKKLEKVEGIKYAGPNYYMYPTSTVTSSSANNLQWGLDKIQLEDAWQIEDGSSNTVRVGVIDTGISAHYDLNANLVTGYNVIDGSTDTNDTNGHGTHVAGIIGASGWISGVTQNVKLVPIKIADGSIGNNKTFASRVISAIIHATNNNIGILNLSWGGRGNSVDLRGAIANYPGLFVTTAGNNDDNGDPDIDKDPYFPGSFILPNLITVSSTSVNDSAGKMDHFICWPTHLGCGWTGHNYGKNTVDIYAPGYDILSTFPEALCNKGTPACNTPAHVAHSYHYMSGTSMAAPHVAGVAALIKSKYPNMTPVQIKAAIMAGVDKVPALSGLCVSGGRLNAFKALHAAEGILWSQPTFTSNSNTHGTVSASGVHGDEQPWKAFNGTMNGGSAGSGDNWSVNATSGWLQLRLNSFIVVHGIEFYNGVSGSSNYTKAAKFTGRGGVPLGNPFTAPKEDLGYVFVPVNNVLTNVIQLNITSSYGNFVNAAAIIIHATVTDSEQIINQFWTQPRWSSNTTTTDGQNHGTITASGTYSNEAPWKAYNGTMNGGSGGNGDNWSVKAKSGWLELRLDYPMYVTSIELWGNTSGSSNRTRAANFTGAGGVTLGTSFELANQNQAYRNVNVGGVWTNIIRLNITSSYGTYIGASLIKIHATV